MKKGFTLIELLVVISIIGLMSSVVMASVTSVRLKAENVATEEAVRVYISALRQYALENGKFPLATATGGGAESDSYFCLGGTTCYYFGTAYSNSSILDSKLLSFVKPTGVFPKFQYSFTMFGITVSNDVQGVMYQCVGNGTGPISLGGDCKTISIVWFKQRDPNCPTLYLPGSNGFDDLKNGYCRYNIDFNKI
jgi:prepilin-type N-terminal cleavage/methylation domain-containing protein